MGLAIFVIIVLILRRYSKILIPFHFFCVFSTLKRAELGRIKKKSLITHLNSFSHLFQSSPAPGRRSSGATAGKSLFMNGPSELSPTIGTSHKDLTLFTKHTKVGSFLGVLLRFRELSMFTIGCS